MGAGGVHALMVGLLRLAPLPGGVAMAVHTIVVG